jgi:hypothetical protein
MSTPKNESLLSRLRAAELYDEFCDLIFAQCVTYTDLLEQLESWGISSSLGALSRFADAQRGVYSMERARRQYEAMINDAGSTLDEAQRRTVAERLFNLAASPDISTGSLLKMRDQEIKLEELKQTERRVLQAERALDLTEKKLEQAERRVLALEAAAEAAETALNRARETVRAASMDDATRAALLSEVDAIMLGKPSTLRA